MTPDALFNHSVLVEYKNLETENEKNIANEIKNAINKINTEIVSVFFLKENKASYDKILLEFEKKERLGDVKGTYDEILLIKKNQVSVLNKNRASPTNVNTYSDKNINLNNDNVNNDTMLFQTEKAQVTSDNFKKWFGDWENDLEGSSKG